MYSVGGAVKFARPYEGVCLRGWPGVGGIFSWVKPDTEPGVGCFVLRLVRWGQAVGEACSAPLRKAYR